MTDERGTEYELLERDLQSAQAHTALQMATLGEGRVLLIQGPAGIGKTELARKVLADSGGQELGVAFAQGDELETEFPFGVVRQLFGPFVLGPAATGRDSLLEGAANLAMRVLVQPAEIDPGDSVIDPGSAFHGLYWLVSNLAERAPLVLIVDDVHWSDQISLEFLHYLARRIESLPVLLVLTERVAAGSAATPVLERIAAQPTCVVMRPEPLSPVGVARLVHAITGSRGDDAFIHTCHEKTGGNPFLLKELLREVRDAEIPVTGASAKAVQHLAPEAVSQMLQVRLARLPPECARLARSLAVLGHGTDLRRAAILAGLEQAEALSAADALTEAGILTSTSPREFVHPLLREALIAAIPSGDRAIAHFEAACLLRSEDAPDNAVAAHLLAAEPAGEEWVVETLRRAAARALSDGAPRSAIRLLERALIEGSQRPTRADVLVELGTAQALVADLAAMETLGEALRLGAEPAKRAEASLELARAVAVIGGDRKAAVHVIDQISDEGLEPALAFRLKAERLALIFEPMSPHPMPTFQELRPLAEGVGADNDVILSLLSFLALMNGEPAKIAVDLARRALQLREDVPGLPLVVLVCADLLEEAEPVIESLIDEGRRLGKTYQFGVATVWRGQIRFRQGNLEEAETDFRVVSEIIRQISPSHPDLSFPNTFLADVLMERGRLDEAEDALAAVAPTSSGHERWFLETRGRLRMAQGRLEPAVEDLSRFQPLSDRFRGPCFLPWRSSLALAFHEMGQHQEAGQLAMEEVELARGQGVPRALGVSLRTLGTVGQKAEEAEEHLQEAAEILEATSADLESAKTLYELGRVIRRRRRPKEARKPLRRALDLAERCGASRLAEAARGELGVAGAKPRRVATTGVDALTPSERRVAQLAAEGLSNRMVAQALFISPWTVAAHLTSVYQKLAITGRAELSRRLQESL